MRETPKNREQEGCVQWRLVDDNLAKENSLEVCSRGEQDARFIRGDKGMPPECQTVASRKGSFQLEAAA